MNTPSAIWRGNICSGKLHKLNGRVIEFDWWTELNVPDYDSSSSGIIAISSASNFIQWRTAWRELTVCHCGYLSGCWCCFRVWFGSRYATDNIINSTEMWLSVADEWATNHLPKIWEKKTPCAPKIRATLERLKLRLLMFPVTVVVQWTAVRREHSQTDRNKSHNRQLTTCVTLCRICESDG